MWLKSFTLVVIFVCLSLMVAFVIGRRRIKPEKKLNLLQLLVTLEYYGVHDIYVSEGSIIMIIVHNQLNLPDWLVVEYNLHRDELWQKLRRVRTYILIVGVTK